MDWFGMLANIIILALGSSAVTDGVKRLFVAAKNATPKKFLPVVATVAGMLGGGMMEAYYPGAGIGMQEGLMGGMMSVVGHQLWKQPFMEVVKK